MASWLVFMLLWLFSLSTGWQYYSNNREQPDVLRKTECNADTTLVFKEELGPLVTT